MDDGEILVRTELTSWLPNYEGTKKEEEDSSLFCDLEIHRNDSDTGN